MTVNRRHGAYEFYEFHAFCNPTKHWDGRTDAPIFSSFFGRLHNHFSPPQQNVRPYLRVHRMSELPTSLRKQGSETLLAGEVAYLLNGDQVHLPRFWSPLT